MTQTPELRAFLKAFHERYPGATSKTASVLRDAFGRSSYDVVAEAILKDRMMDSLLDIGCGDGAFLGQLSALCRSATFSGIDLVENEVLYARSISPTANIVVGDLTERLPFADGEFDTVTAHLVLMLLGPLDATLDGIARVLRPNGLFAFVIDDLADTPNVYERLMRRGMESAGTLKPGTRFNTAADERLHDEDALRRLLRDHRFNVIRLRRYQVRASICSQSAWHHFQRAYPIGLLDGPQQERARMRSLPRLSEKRLQR
jgi:predicted TPR repeat methyltransferase